MVLELQKSTRKIYLPTGRNLQATIRMPHGGLKVAQWVRVPVWMMGCPDHGD